MARYWHNNEGERRVCVSPNNCKFDGGSFSTPEAADKYIEEKYGNAAIPVPVKKTEGNERKRAERSK